MDGIDGTRARFYDIARDDAGGTYVCGGNNDVSPKVLLYRVSKSGSWSPVLTTRMLLDLGGTGFSDCENVIVFGAKTIIVDDLAGRQIAWSTDGGSTWAKTELPRHVYELEASGERILGAGGATGTGPAFFVGSAAAPGDTAMRAVVVGKDNRQEARGMATPDGARWIIAGAFDTGEEYLGAWILFTDDQGNNWNEASVADATQVSFFNDVVCAARRCFAVGTAYPSDDGLVYESTDGGETWRRMSGIAGSTAYTTASFSGRYVYAAGDGLDIARISP
jgi:hypothetical protein